MSRQIDSPAADRFSHIIVASLRGIVPFGPTDWWSWPIFFIDVGPAGIGKSHLAQAIGHRGCRAGYAVHFTNANEMLRQLRATRADGSFERRMLIIDDLGLRPLAHDEPLDLFEIIRQRYERASTIITSNRDADELAKLFGEPLLAGSVANRNPNPHRRKRESSSTWGSVWPNQPALVDHCDPRLPDQPDPGIRLAELDATRKGEP